MKECLHGLLCKLSIFPANRNQLEREISQTLEQVRYEYEICKRKAIQDQVTIATI